MSGFNTGLYESGRSGIDTMGRQAFLFAISMFTAIFIAVSALGASFSIDWTFSNNTLLFLLFLLGCVVVSIGGAILAHSHDDPMTSVVGGLICAGAMGLMVGPFVGLYELGSVGQAFGISAGIVVLTGLIGAIMPKDLSAWGAPLFAGVLGLIGLYLVVPFLALLGINIEFAVSVLDVVGIALFSAIMVYDLNMAVRLDKTLNNAIDVAVNVFLNFANIFIRVLALMGNAKKS